MPDTSPWWKKLIATIRVRVGALLSRDPPPRHGESVPREGQTTPITMEPSPPLVLQQNESWDPRPRAVDSFTRAAIAFLKQGDPLQLFVPVAASPDFPGRSLFVLPLHIELNERYSKSVEHALRELGLIVPGLYLDAAAAGSARDLRCITARTTPFAMNTPELNDLPSRIQKILNSKWIRRMELAVPLPPCRAGTLRDIGLPADRKVQNTKCDGRGVVIGIIDDGCAFANWNFIKGHRKSRLRYLWDQSNTPKDPGKGWKSLSSTTTTAGAGLYGYELPNLRSGTPWIDNALKAHTVHKVIDEEAVYAQVGYRPELVGSHGTHVMDVAAGRGHALFGAEGMAPSADIIFVQLPRDVVDYGGTALSQCLADGAEYIYNRAAALGKPAVVNISYGGYVGPHDGTSIFELQLDDQLQQPNRATVIAAGNGFAALCHAAGNIAIQATETIDWWVPPDDPTMNVLDLWYNGDAILTLLLTPPGASAPLQPVELGQVAWELKIGTTVVGTVDHFAKDAGNDDHHIRVILRPTTGGMATLAGAPFGRWQVGLANSKKQMLATYHAWIERDASRPGAARRRGQSHFYPLQADPRYTISGIATGRKTLAVGGYNTATGEVPDYSACGPTRPTTSRPSEQKPEVCAPSASDVRGRGVLSASSLRAMDTRMNGTSIAAPHVAGLAALVMQLHRKKNGTGAPLPVGTLRAHIMNGAVKGTGMPNPRPLRYSQHQLLDPAQPIKQTTVTLPVLTGKGLIHVEETLKGV